MKEKNLSEALVCHHILMQNEVTLPDRTGDHILALRPVCVNVLQQRI